jgi:hypothetical protein
MAEAKEDEPKKETPVQWPQDAAASTGSDLGPPLVSLLKQVDLLPGEESKNFLEAAITGSSKEVTVVKSGALALSKYWAAALGLSGASAAVAPLVNKEFWDKLPPQAQLGFFLACGLIASTCVLGLCYLLASDVRGRASATTEQIGQRAAIVSEFLRTSQAMQNRTWEGDAVLRFLTTAVATDGSIKAKIGEKWEPIRGFERRNGQVGIAYAGAWKPLAELSEFKVGDDDPPEPVPTPVSSKDSKPPDNGAPDLGKAAKDFGDAVVKWFEVPRN